MSYTGHKQLLINKQNIVDHIRETMRQEAQFYNVAELPSDEQIALVISALRMHHTMVHASEYDYSELHAPDQKTDFYPVQSSIGRYFRDAAGEILRDHSLKVRRDA